VEFLPAPPKQPIRGHQSWLEVMLCIRIFFFVHASEAILCGGSGEGDESESDGTEKN
jgi:hypothetical protein